MTDKVMPSLLIVLPIAFFSFLTPATQANAEELKMTTWYPAPYGVYTPITQ